MVKDVESWGRVPIVGHRAVELLRSRHDLPDLNAITGSVLPYGLGRSYGDSCLNENGTLVGTRFCNRFISLDEEAGLLRCEAGLSLDEILRVIVPRGFFLPVTPGTKFVTVGGAIANDVHGKNHHVQGSFGCHVTQFALYRSDGTTHICSATTNADLFRATIGGLGLTGLILWAEFALIRIPSSFIEEQSTRFRNIDEYLDVSAEADKHFDYVVSWIDCSSSGSSLGRGIFQGGNFCEVDGRISASTESGRTLSLGIDAPSWLLNSVSVKIFNSLYYHQQFRNTRKRIRHYEPFFYPLDSLHQWNRMYGKRGFFQYQFVVPFEQSRQTLHAVLSTVARSGQASFLSVIKNFGPRVSPGLLSFPIAGVTLAMDFKNQGQRTLNLMSDLDAIVRGAGGRLYPAKDARMSAEHFQEAFPTWKEFRDYIDPKFSSSYWRRVSSP